MDEEALRRFNRSLHAAHRRARRVVPRHRAGARPVAAAVRDRRRRRPRARAAPPARPRLRLPQPPAPPARAGGLDHVSRRSGRRTPAHRAARERGRREWRRLDTRSEQLARRLVEPLSERQRESWPRRSTTAERLLRAATVELELVDPRPPTPADAGEYFGELDERFPTGFDADAAGGRRRAAALAPPGGAFVVMRTDLTPSAAAACSGSTTPPARSSGCGSTPTGAVSASDGGWWTPRARRRASSGTGRVVLDTNDSLDEAIAMYGARDTTRSSATTTTPTPTAGSPSGWVEKTGQERFAWVTGILTTAVVAPGRESNVMSPWCRRRRCVARCRGRARCPCRRPWW